MSHSLQSLRRLALCLLLAGSALRAEPVISEFMAANATSLADQDGMYSDWVEIHNPDATPINLAGWHLTDSATNKAKWQFPAVTVPAGGYVVVFASGKDRRISGGELHTNFALSASGEYLGLVKPDGLTAVAEITPTFPAQQDDVSYGLIGSGANASWGFLSKPTPGNANAAADSTQLAENVTFSRAAGPFRGSFTLELSGAGAGQVIRYVIAPGSEAAGEVSATSPTYRSPISIAASTVVRAAVFAADGSVKGPTRTAYYARIAPSLSTFASQLPIVVLDNMGGGSLVKDNIDHASWLYSYPAHDSGTAVFNSAPELISPADLSVRGNSSAQFPKKGYNLKFTDELGQGNPEALLGLPAYEKWALVGPWAADWSYVNNALIYSLSNQMGRWAPRTRFTEVFFNANGGDIDQADYAGIYLVTDRIEVAQGRVDVAELSAGDVSGSAVSGGYIFKIDHADTDEIHWTTSRGMPAFEDSSIVLVSPKADDVAPAQLDYLRDYVQRMENALVADRDSGFAQRTYLDYIDRDAWIDHHILNSFACNPDALIRSAYFTKPRNGKLAAGPVWDFDRTLGSNWDERSFRPNVWSGLGTADPWRTGWWGILMQDPEFMQDWIDRWFALRQSELATGNLWTQIEALSAQIGNAAVLRDWAKWPDNISTYGSYAAQIDHLKGWVEQRVDWIDGQFLNPPSVAPSGTSLTFTAPEGAQLIYTLDGSDPRLLGGEIAPNAIVSSKAVSVPASANVHIRSYNAALKGIFPGSPWSAAVGGDKSSPLTPRARLVNISTRAMVGTGENALIAGVVVADTESKRYLSRAIGPALAAFGASGVVPDPQLSIFNSSTVEIFRNNGWGTGVDATRLPSYSRAVGAFPLAAGSSDSALASAVSSGAYTVQITTPSNQPGIGLAELYELDANGRTVNLSTRARVGTGDGVLIGGFVVAGPAYKRMLVRAVGPTLSAFGVGNALADPVLTVYSGQNIVATNDRWEISENPNGVMSASSSAGAFALSAGSQDAALLITLPPGAYTVEVRGKGDTEGVALLEIYEVP